MERSQRTDPATNLRGSGQGSVANREGPPNGVELNAKFLFVTSFLIGAGVSLAKEGLRYVGAGPIFILGFFFLRAGMQISVQIMEDIYRQLIQDPPDGATKAKYLAAIVTGLLAGYAANNALIF